MDEQRLADLIAEAIACHHGGEYRRELELWVKIQAIRPAPQWEHNVALALMNTGRYLEALEIFDKLASQNPHLSRVHNNRAALLMRMGLDLQFLAPVFVQALTNSEDMAELIRHFVNLCGTIAFGFDQKQDEAFNFVEEKSVERLRYHSPADLFEKNRETFLKMLSGYRHVAAYRQAFAERKWRTGLSPEISAIDAVRISL
jgi:tetratricopeptide (TPR) repeat protein